MLRVIWNPHIAHNHAGEIFQRLERAAGAFLKPLEIAGANNKYNSDPMQAPNIENIVIDEANQRKYVVLATRVLSDGEIYRAIRQEILRRGGKPLPQGETLTLTLPPPRGSSSSQA